MLLMKYMLIASGTMLFAAAAAVLLFDAYRAWRLSRSLVPADMATPPIRLRWVLAARLIVIGFLILLPALSIVVVPSGMAAAMLYSRPW